MSNFDIVEYRRALKTLERMRTLFAVRRDDEVFKALLAVDFGDSGDDVTTVSGSVAPATADGDAPSKAASDNDCPSSSLKCYRLLLQAKTTASWYHYRSREMLPMITRRLYNRLKTLTRTAFKTLTRTASKTLTRTAFNL